MKIDYSIEGLGGLQAIADQYGALTMNKTFATALTRTALHLREVQRSELVRSLDRPTPYTIRAIQMVNANGNLGGATADSLAVDVRIADAETNKGTGRPSVRWLWWQVDGGANRQLKGFEKALQAKGLMPKGWYAVPGAGARLDPYGNVSPGQIVQILSQLHAGNEKGKLSFMAKGTDKKSQRSRARAMGRAGGQFFAVTETTKKRNGLAPGIYMNSGTDMGARRGGYKSTGYIKPVLIFVRGVAYARRYDFMGTANSVINYTLPEQLDRALADTKSYMSQAK